MTEHLASLKLHIRYINDCISEIEEDMDSGYIAAYLQNMKERSLDFRVDLLELKIANNSMF
jgi:hypothetical protein